MIQTNFERTSQPRTDFSAGALDRIAHLLRGEISAVEAYEHVLNRFAMEPDIKRLEEIKTHHENAVKFWTSLMAERGVEPHRESGPWGHIVKTFVDTAQFFGDTASLRVLLAGESHGLNEYQEVLMDSSMPSFLKDKVREHFIPQQEQHIALLEAWKGN